MLLNFLSSKSWQVQMEYLKKMDYNNTQVLIARHYDTDHPHVHLIINRIDFDGKRISDQNERLRSVRVCKELTEKHGLYFAQGKESVKRHRLKEPDKTKYEIYDALQKHVQCSRNWQELVNRLHGEGIAVEFKTKGSTSQIEGVKFQKSGFYFNGSQIDRQFSYSKIDYAIRQNSYTTQQTGVAHNNTEYHVTNVGASQPPNVATFGTTTSDSLGGIFDILDNPTIDPAEEEFSRQMQRKKKKRRLKL